MNLFYWLDMRPDMYNIPFQDFFKYLNLIQCIQSNWKEISNMKNETIQMEKVSYKIYYKLTKPLNKFTICYLKRRNKDKQGRAKME